MKKPHISSWKAGERVSNKADEFGEQKKDRIQAN